MDRIADSGQCFRWEKAGEDVWRIPAGASCLYMTHLPDGRYLLDCEEEEYQSFWKSYFDLDVNYRQIRERIDPDRDPFLRQAADQEQGIRILRQDPWEMLITFIISQNRNIPAIRRSVEMLAQRCGKKRTDSRGRIYYAFPEPEDLSCLSEEELKDCRLGYRWKYVKSAAGAVAQGEIRLDQLCGQDHGTVMESLTSLYGVGEKVASCVSLFGFHHVDAFPKDVWIRRVLEEKYPQGYPFEDYAPYNGIYQQYMFAYYRNHPEARE